MAPPPTDKQTRSASTKLARRLLVVCALLILYGSLYPFEYLEPPSVAGAWRQLVLVSTWWTSPGDVMGNVVLFVPWGALGAVALAHTARRQRGLAWFVVWSLLFAFAVQVIQIWFPSRTPSRADVLWNAVGILCGMSAARALARILSRMQGGVASHAHAALALVALWGATQWAPLIPTVDWQGVKDSVKPLLLHPEWNPIAILLTTARVLAVGCMLQAVCSPGRSMMPGFAVMLVALIAGKPFIVGQSITLTNVLGYLAGYACWWVLQNRDEQRRVIATLALLFAACVLNALTPFEWRDTPTQMHLLPFAAMLEGSMELNARALLDGSFIYGALLWLAQRSSGRVIGTSIALALCVLALEYAQLWLEGRTGDITEPLLALAAGTLLAAAQPSAEHRAPTAHDARWAGHARTRRSH